MTEPSPTDPEIAAATFATHLDDFFVHGRGRSAGWDRIRVDDLHVVVQIPGMRADGTVDPYFVMLGAEYYPVWPVSAAFVRRLDDGAWEKVTEGSGWWPRQQNQPGFSFGLHAAYTYRDGAIGPLICFSFTLEYYLTDHSPTEDERWDQRRHTVTATLSRLGDILRAPNYQEPSGDRNS
jgi:hypothetical protein